MMTTFQKICLALFLYCLSTATSLHAAEEPEKFLFEAGAFLTDVDTSIAVDVNGGTIGTSVDLEDDLGYKNDKTINRINALYRFTNKHSLHYSFFKLDRSNAKSLEKTFIIGGEDYPVDADITSTFDYTIHYVTYGYALHNEADYQFDLMAGLYYLKVGFSISALGIGASTSVAEKGPLPLVGFSYAKPLSDRWNLSLRGAILKFDINDIDGALIDTRLRVDYEFSDKVALGLAYNWQRFRVGVLDSDLDSRFSMTTTGPELALVLRF